MPTGGMISSMRTDGLEDLKSTASRLETTLKLAQETRLILSLSELLFLQPDLLVLLDI